MTSLTSFTVFSDLAPEIRDQIWAFTLPPVRVMHVRPPTRVMHFRPPTRFPHKASFSEYTTSPASYGAQLPVILSVNRDSRATALRHLTLRFNCYWNLDIDYLYIDVKKWGADDAMRQLYEMRTNGLLEGFKHLALDSNIWQSVQPEHCMTSIRLLPSVSTCAFVFKGHNWHIDIVDPGISWFFRPVGSEDHAQFDSYRQPCFLARRFEEQRKEYRRLELAEDQKAWEERGTRLQLMYKVIGGRKVEQLPTSPAYYEPPGEDWFG